MFETSVAVEFNKDGWRSRAVCAGSSPQTFFLVGRSGANKRMAEHAKYICSTCSSQRHCLEYAVLSKEEEGIWGGCTPEERAVLARSGVYGVS